MLKTFGVLTLVVSCGGSQHNGGKTYTCEEAATQMADYFHAMTKMSGDPRYGALADKGATITLDLCHSDKWSPNAIWCIADYNDDGPHACVVTGHGVGDAEGTCPLYEGQLDKYPAYSPGCTGFTKTQAETYRKAMIATTTCDPGLPGKVPNSSGVPVNWGISCPKAQ